METDLKYTIVHRDELPHDGNTYEFEGFRFSETEASFIWVDMSPGGTIRLHQHPYPEIFIIQEGVSTFVVGDSIMQAGAGQIIVVPANVPHKFSNHSNTQLKQVDIHVSRQFITHWLED